MVPKSSYGPPTLNSNRFECPPGTSGFRASSADCCVQLPKTICFYSGFAWLWGPTGGLFPAETLRGSLCLPGRQINAYLQSSISNRKFFCLGFTNRSRARAARECAVANCFQGNGRTRRLREACRRGGIL